MNSNQEILLVPVIELPPSNFCSTKKEAPKKSYIEAPEIWKHYNEKCYNDAGLFFLKPIEPLSWLFKLEDLTEVQLKIILKYIFNEAVEYFESINEILADPIEYAPLISGGYLLMVDNIVKSQPGCCCGLENIIEWKEATTVFTGHEADDLVYINRQNTKIEISIKQEVITISQENYLRVIKEAEIKIDNFIKKSGKLLNEILNIENGVSLAKSMIYKWD